MGDWFVVNTHPHQEGRAELNLRRQGYEARLPRLLRSRRHARRLDMTSVPLFPGYIFVRLDRATQPWRAINSTFGIRRILCDGERPLPVEDGFVEALQSSTDDLGIVGLAESDLKPGQPLRLVAGPFADCIGTLLQLSDRDRVALLLNLLGREVRLVVPRQQVVAVA
jgi:transcriptional antiterminator RfaH